MKREDNRPLSGLRRHPLLLATTAAVAALIAAMATLIGTAEGQDAADRWVYAAPWFTALWALAAALGVAWIVRRKVRRASTLTLHAAFLVILLGALVTHVGGHRGTVHLRQGATATHYDADDGTRRPLGFGLRLERFDVDYHAGQAAPMDYRSTVTLSDGGGTTRHAVSMNHILAAHGLRLYQSGYDDDLRGATLAVNDDAWGIGVTYAGYALLLVALLWMLADPRGRFRRLLSGVGAQGARVALLALVAASALPLRAQRTLTPEEADELGGALIVYNGRVCPLETFALDFTRKLHGARTYHGMSAVQVLAGCALFPDDWLAEPFLRIKGRQLRERLGGVGEYVAPADLLRDGYRLGPMLQEAQTKRDKLSEQVLDVDDRLVLLMQVMRMESLRMFPYPTRGGGVEWLSPAQTQPRAMPAEQRAYVRTILPLAASLSARGDHERARDAIGRLLRYQAAYGAGSIPPRWRLRAERAYNAVPLPTVLFMVNLALALLSAALLARRRGAVVVGLGALLSWTGLTLTLALRWAASGNVPLGNGYETMLLLAWLTLGASLVAARRFRPMLTLGLMASGLMLLVSHLSQMDPAISQRMPVLNSPLLTVHVSVVMLSYALLSLTFMASAAYFLSLPLGARADAFRRSLKPLSELFLYPAVATLAAGIFIGAVWANVSWGAYWSWDPKETWALITLLVYAAPLHQSSYAALRTPRGYHLYLLLAFASLVVTYFGVNYLMSGMHSYA